MTALQDVQCWYFVPWLQHQNGCGEKSLQLPFAESEPDWLCHRIHWGVCIVAHFMFVAFCLFACLSSLFVMQPKFYFRWPYCWFSIAKWWLWIKLDLKSQLPLFTQCCKWELAGFLRKPDEMQWHDLWKMASIP